jgi:hypothetical protein
MGAQIPVIPEKPLAVCGYRKFKIDTLGDHLCTCLVKNRGQDCGDIELTAYLSNVGNSVPLVLDLRIPHDHFDSSVSLLLMEDYTILIT